MSADNPWLTIPLADYEAHMALPQVGQAQLLAELFAAELRTRSPSSVAVLGCAGGNGFEHAPAALRVVGVDVNADYVAAARARFASRLPRLELHVADLERAQLDLEPVELVFAALVLEYVEPESAPKRLVRLAARSGLRASDTRIVTATGGKRFAVQSFARG